ncbi:MULTISPECIES: hypothetical protein [Pseudomonas]|uniref:Helix-turn-helix domain-containing protein n=3 Tax=Pseudomonas syringae group genomosp. 2 TaxID=251698 RepID=A0AAX1W1U0_PSEAJ|nr:hypothetical protein [Pseudomonas amygdali]KPX71683.1 Uncharacterized protein ALO35_02310 [Pseudomonas amygdali pv. lachrymans]RML78297.1 hypothetical protein ALQ89_03671 [Pseudomonas amygdali pv. tabaci]BCS42453.1 hypothetical protein Pta6605_07840 [Pseudomonas amygdali pv. tabaci]
MNLMWAKMPNRWVMGGGLAGFSDRNGAGKLDVTHLNSSIAALKVYLAVCTRAKYETGIARTTYPELSELVGMSRSVIARSLRILEAHQLLRRDSPNSRAGSIIYVTRWLEDKGFAKIPKSWLYHGRGAGEERAPKPEQRLVKLNAFKFHKRISLQALKAYIALIAMRSKDGKDGHGLTVISYDRISDLTGIPRHSVSMAVTLLLEMNLISFRPGSYSEGDGQDFDRTNRYLIKGLNLRFRALEDETQVAKVRVGKVSGEAVAAELTFMSQTR